MVCAIQLEHQTPAALAPNQWHIHSATELDKSWTEKSNWYLNIQNLRHHGGATTQQLTVKWHLVLFLSLQKEYRGCCVSIIAIKLSMNTWYALSSWSIVYSVHPVQLTPLCTELNLFPSLEIYPLLIPCKWINCTEVLPCTSLSHWDSPNSDPLHQWRIKLQLH